MASNAKVNGVDDFVVAVVFVAVEIGGLAAVTCQTLAAETVACRDQRLNRSNERIANHLVWRL